MEYPLHTHSLGINRRHTGATVEESASVLATNRRVPVEGVSFSITCTLDAAISGSALFYKGLTSNQGGCLSSGSCGTYVSGYNVSLDSTSRILTLDIASANSTRDSGTWTCTDGATSSNSITLSQFAAVLNWSSVTFSPQLTSLPSSVTPQNNISVTVTTPCAAPAAVITWRYQQVGTGVSGVPPSSTSSTLGSCPSGQVQTTDTLSLPGNTVSLSSYCFVFTGCEWRPSQQYIFHPGIMSTRSGPDNQHPVSTREHSQSLQQAGVSHCQCGT
ncbi:uncharacterized protein LOC124254634 isoform X1 [Haliotis rubra]|uniref:uncharacterized protein LOC124254634 isoform X1 n=1 Tax=Haliotis rubra TaxID=36100 RepID=UPI001EE517CD|nr:uncharacterized protein LOC124254634 isoform X1 [Haliotis rubra]